MTATQRPPFDKLRTPPFDKFWTPVEPRGRRAFLIFSLAAGLGLAGCTSGSHDLGRSDSSPTTRRPLPSPTPLPGTVAAAAQESHLAAYAAAALHHFGKHLTVAQRHLLSGLRDAHLAHAAVLGQVDPSVIDPTPGPSATPSDPTRPAASGPASSASAPALGRDPKSTLDSLRRLETEASKSYASHVATPGVAASRQGSLVLLWGSLATAAAGYAALCRSGTDPGATVIGRRRVAVRRPDQDTAIGNLLSQCYAIIFGYQSAIAYLSAERAEAARDRLADYRDLRDRLAGQLSDDKTAVPVPHAAYQLPVQPKSDRSATRLIGLMETRMLPYFGQWLAAVDIDGRSRVLGTMIAAVKYDLGWSPRINVWPGYPTA